MKTCFSVLGSLSEFLIFGVFGSLHHAFSVVFQGVALFTKVRRRLYRGLFVNVDGILRAVLTPMPLIIVASLHILHHSRHFVSFFYY
jgi:hypothetical protein